MIDTLEKRLGRSAVRRVTRGTQVSEQRRLPAYDPDLEASFLLTDLWDDPDDTVYLYRPDWIEAEIVRFEQGIEAAERAGVWHWHQNPPVLSRLAYNLVLVVEWSHECWRAVSRSAADPPDPAEWEQFDWASGKFTDEWKLRFPPDSNDKQRFTEWRQARTTSASAPVKKRR